MAIVISPLPKISVVSQLSDLISLISSLVANLWQWLSSFFNIVVSRLCQHPLAFSRIVSLLAIGLPSYWPSAILLRVTFDIKLNCPLSMYGLNVAIVWILPHRSLSLHAGSLCFSPVLTSVFQFLSHCGIITYSELLSFFLLCKSTCSQTLNLWIFHSTLGLRSLFPIYLLHAFFPPQLVTLIHTSPQQVIITKFLGGYSLN